MDIPTPLVVAELAAWNGGAQRIEYGRQIDDLLEDGAAGWRQPPPKAMNIPMMLNAIPPTAL